MDRGVKVRGEMKKEKGEAIGKRKGVVEGGE